MTHILIDKQITQQKSILDNLDNNHVEINNSIINSQKYQLQIHVELNQQPSGITTTSELKLKI